MAMIRTASTSGLAQRIHDAATDSLGDAQWVAEKVWYTAGELRVRGSGDAEETGPTAVSSGSACVYPGAGLDSGIHQYTFYGFDQDQPSSANASRREIDVELRGESEVETGVAKLEDFRFYRDQSLDLSGYSSTVMIKESNGGYREDKSYSLSFASNSRYDGSIAENYIYAADSEVHDNVTVISLPGSGDNSQRAAACDHLLVAANQSGQQIVVGFINEDKKAGYVFVDNDGVAGVDMATRLVGVTSDGKISPAGVGRVISAAANDFNCQHCAGFGFYETTWMRC
ncbi:hypothetical protein KRX52_12435 [Pseudomonas sp. MAP12]|uniref:Uncharacterized protein n=1 Tax=Geopseudomonas aromaticivorans TaxID=2849492 RepID=A0ABS6MXW1_9GAMM|nr:hypothetical protein [Pseudomonas aromaticivorans]MBV2133600.1 hypothetical protein [Pseudomonas aromaticivorans]